jgi:hypothetical protein
MFDELSAMELNDIIAGDPRRAASKLVALHGIAPDGGRQISVEAAKEIVSIIIQSAAATLEGRDFERNPNEKEAVVVVSAVKPNPH